MVLDPLEKENEIKQLENKDQYNKNENNQWNDINENQSKNQSRNDTNGLKINKEYSNTEDAIGVKQNQAWNNHNGNDRNQSLEIEGKEYETITRPTINSRDEQRCLKDYQITMLQQHNRYRRLKFLDPLEVSKKLQYVALLAAQRCSENVENKEEVLKKTNPYDTGEMSIIQDYANIDECEKNAIILSESWYKNRNYWIALNDDQKYKYLGCAVSIKYEVGCHVCYYQGEKGHIKLQNNYVPRQSQIDLKSYADNFWKNDENNMKCKSI